MEINPNGVATNVMWADEKGMATTPLGLEVFPRTNLRPARILLGQGSRRREEADRLQRALNQKEDSGSGRQGGGGGEPR